MTVQPSKSSQLAATRPIAKRVAIAGLGAVGFRLVEELDGKIDGFVLAAVAARDKSKAQARLSRLSRPVKIVDIDHLEPLADIVVECAPAEYFARIAEPFLQKGKIVIALSAGALLTNGDLIALARERGGQIVVPSGALLGLDAVTAAAEGKIRSVRMVTRKPVSGLAGAPYLVDNRMNIDSIKEPVRIFSGTAREAAIGFPANLNVAAALSLAGLGPDLTRVEIWADPGLTRNVHRIEVESDAATFEMSIENVPTDNPKTGRITAQSVIAYLRKMHAPLRIGS